MAVANEITLRNESQIWDLIRGLATAKIKSEDVTLEFVGFPVLEIKIDGPNFNGSLPARVMDALCDLQKDIYRIYAIAVHDDETYVLTKEEKEKLEFFVKVDKGSSNINIDLTEVLNTAVREGLKKMKPIHVFTAISIACVGWVGNTLVHEYFETKRANAQADADVKRTEEETKRLQIIKEMLRVDPSAEKVLSITEKTNRKLIKSIRPNEQITTPDHNTIDYTEAKEMFKTTRNQPEETKVDGTYIIKMIESPSPGVFRAKIENTEDGTERTAEISLDDPDLKEILLSALSNRAPIDLQVNGRIFKGTIRDCTIVGMN